MKTWVHFLFSLIPAVLLYHSFGWKVAFILAGGVLIDIDHYAWYVCKYRKYSLTDCYNHYMDADKTNFKDIIGILMIFHTIEFLLLMLVLSFFNQFVSMFTIGLLVHYLLDLIWHISIPKRIITSVSVISWIIKNKQKF